MSFEKKTWKYGDEIHATDMNRIEQGIADADLCLKKVISTDTGINSSYNELKEASANKIVVCITTEEQGTMTRTYFDYLASLSKMSSTYYATFGQALNVAATDPDVNMREGGGPK